VYSRISYQVKQRAGDRGITAENMEQHSNFNKDKTNESTGMAVKAGQRERMEKQVLRPLR